MKAVTAREANQGFSELLSRVEDGEEVMITKHGRPVAMLTPYRPPALTAERQRAIEQAKTLMSRGIGWPKDVQMPARDEMHER